MTSTVLANFLLYISYSSCE